MQMEKPAKKPSMAPQIILYVVLAAIVFGVGGYYLGTRQSKDTTAATASATPTAVAPKTLTPTASATANITASWKTYTSEELGVSFKYPEAWGKIFARGWEPTANDPTKGKSFSISIGSEEYGLSNPRVTGFTADYSPFEAIANEYYVGNQANLDQAETNPALPSEGSSSIGFKVKNTVAGQKTMINNSMEGVPEGSGISVASKVFLNGKTEYKGIVVAMTLKGIQDRLSKLYDAGGSMEPQLNSEAVSELTKLKDGAADSSTMASYDEYKAWLSTFQFTK